MLPGQPRTRLSAPAPAMRQAALAIALGGAGMGVTPAASFLHSPAPASVCPAHVFCARPISRQRQRAWARLAVADGGEDALVSAIERVRGASGHPVLLRRAPIFRPAAQRRVRVTASDVAAAGGFEIGSAHAALSLLATAVEGAAMEVTQDGQIVFVLPADYRQALRNRRSPAGALAAKSAAIAATATKAVFGLLLLLSFAAVRPLVDSALGTPAASTPRRVRGDDDLPTLGGELSALRALVLDELRGDASAASSAAAPAAPAPAPSASLLLACFAFLFGGQDPGRRRVQDEEMAAIAAAIRANRGAVTVEQVAPFLLDTATMDDIRERRAAGDIFAVEDCMLPILTRFGGLPRVTEEGDIVYVFPDLLPTTARGAPALVRSLDTWWKKRVAGPGSSDFLEERQLDFMPGAHRRQLGRVLAVVAVNWVGLLLMGAALGPLQLYLRAVGAGGSLFAINLL